MINENFAIPTCLFKPTRLLETSEYLNDAIATKQANLFFCGNPLQPV